MKKIVGILFAFTLTIGTFLSFNISSAQAKSLEEEIQKFCGPDFYYAFNNGNDNPEAKVGETFHVDFACDGTAVEYNAYIRVSYPVRPSFKEFIYGSKAFSDQKSYQIKVDHSGNAQVVFTFKDAKGKELTFDSEQIEVYSTKAPKMTGIEGSTDFMEFKKKSTFTIKNKQTLYVNPISNADEMNYTFSAQLLNNKKKAIAKKYVSEEGAQTFGVKPSKKGTYYVKVTQKNFYTGKTASKTCKLIVK